jgi:hypothetical protein
MDMLTYMRSVQHAAELSGGDEALAARLRVPVHEVRAWSAGTRQPSTADYLLILDLVITETKKLTREAMARGAAEMAIAKAARRDHAA